MGMGNYTKTEKWHSTIKYRYESGAAKFQKEQYQQRILKYNKTPKKCKYCESIIEYHNKINNFCSQSCSAKYYNAIRPNKHGKFKKIVRPCMCCGCDVVKESIVKKVYCVDCKYKAKVITKQCAICNKVITYKKRKTCSDACYQISLSDSGKKSANIQRNNRRSKNEQLFYEYCKDVGYCINNEQICDGWDADVYFPDIKLAVFWNGNWHYKEISKKCSLLQIQTRDNIKLNLFSKNDIKVYIIKDTGKFNELFVRQEFDAFKHWFNNL